MWKLLSDQSRNDRSIFFGSDRGDHIETRLERLLTFRTVLIYAH